MYTLYCQLLAGNRPMDPSIYAQAYFNVFKQSLQTLEKQIEMTRQKENEELGNMFK